MFEESSRQITAIPWQIMPALVLNIFKLLCRITVPEGDENGAHVFCAMSSVLVSTYRDLFSVLIFECSCFFPYCAEAKRSIMNCIEVCRKFTHFHSTSSVVKKKILQALFYIKYAL